ncbi:uncharacterized protein LOC144103688 [Amblyomma americanum]
MLQALVVLVLSGSPLATASVQRPTLTSCSSSGKLKVSDVSITNAKIGQIMVVNVTLEVGESLRWNPSLEITMLKESGSRISCISDVGSCTYKLCGGTTSAEQELAKPWENRCPVPAITAQESIRAELNPIVQLVIGYAPTTISMELKVVNGGKTVGCQSFKVMIAAA